MTTKQINFHETLKKLRESKKMSQATLAEKLGIDQTAVSKYERAKQLPEVRTLVKISELFDITLDELIFSTGFTQEELQFMEDAKKISVEQLLNNYELVVDGVAATEEEIEEAVRMIKFNRFQS